MDGPSFGQHIGNGIGTLVGVGIGLATGGLGAMIAVPLGRAIGGKIGAWWDQKQAVARAKALEGITGESVDQLLAEFDTWASQQEAARGTLAAQDAWWDTPEATAAYAQYAAVAEYDPTLLGEAGADLSTEIVPVSEPEAPLDFYPAEEVVPVEIPAEEPFTLPDAEGGFLPYAPPPEEVSPVPVEFVPASPAPVATAPPAIVQVELLGAWDSMITAYAGADGAQRCLDFLRNAGAGTCRVRYADGSTMKFDAVSVLTQTVPGTPVSFG
jgi:hypothetical protein